VWLWGVPDKEKRKLSDHLKAIALLKDHGLRGTGVIRAYHARRVAPLMVRALPLYVMIPVAQLGRMVLVEGRFMTLRSHTVLRTQPTPRRVLGT
jgi:hypothetical protein